MPIKSLESYLFERGLVGSYPIEALKNATLGIDVNHYISRLLTSKREQYLDAIGGFPTSLKMYLESDLKVFKEYNITPVFVFSGSLVRDQLEDSGYLNGYAAEASNHGAAAAAGIHPASPGIRANKESIYSQRHRGWTQWNNLVTSYQNSYIDQPVPPQEPFRYNTTIETKRFQADLFAYFIDREIIYQVAPYASWSQLSSLLYSGYIDAIYGPTDCLMLSNVDKFILGMEFPNREFRFIDKMRIFKEFNCSYDEFVDIAMAVGNDLQPTTLPPLQIYPVPQLFEIALEMVIATGTNFYAYQFSNPVKTESAEFISKYQKGVSALRYMPVLKDNGRIEFCEEGGVANDARVSAKSELSGSNITASQGEKMDPKDKGISSTSSTPRPIPTDVHDFIAQKLPAEYYFYRSLGLASGRLFDAITTGVYPVEPPLDGGFTTSYRNLVKKSVDVFKNKEINLLTQPINRYYQIKPIKQVNWFSPDDPSALTNRISPPIFEKLNHLIVKTDVGDKRFSISNFIELMNSSRDLSQDFISPEVISPNSVPLNKKISAPFDLLSTSFLRSLHLLEFFDYDTSKKMLKPTAWGSVFLKFNELGVESQYQEPIFVLLVFIKMNVLSLAEETAPPASSALSQATLRSYPKESLYILLLTRVLTLYQVEQKSSNYHGPIDKKTLIFSDHLDFVRENLDDLFEAVIISSLTSGEFDRLSLNNYQWQQKIVRNCPFKLSTPNTIMAMMYEFFLQKYLHNGNAKSDAVSLIASEFQTVKYTPNLEEQLQRAQKFLEQCSSVLNELSVLGLIKKEDATSFNNAVQFSCKAVTD
ncbi:MKT1 (YNL085W) [Zygosaccharomyces parabailii]|nr:MKT1 (YNL085W) [Zygosaccharomyces parabailii]